MRLSAIVVAFGNEALTTECLVRLADALARVEGGTELIVVANDGRARTRPGVTTVPGRPELGFAGGVEAGLAVACGEWVALVNDDCAVEQDALCELLEAGTRDARIGSVAAQIRFASRPETINSAGIEVDELGVARERRVGEPAAACETDPVDVFGASAALALYRRTMLDEVGGLDSSFFAYLEDADLAWRARAAGWRCVLAPRAVAYHHHSPALGHGSAAKYLLVGRNRVRMLAKNATASQLRRNLARIVLYDLVYVAYAAAADRTLAATAGRLKGLREWRAYRTAGRRYRHELRLAPSPGIAHARRRNEAYRAVGRPAGGRG
jgi:GT2 family glycosyltransferase